MNSDPPCTRIYIVEDLEILRTGLQYALANEPEFSVVGAASDGLTASRQVIDMRPDIVLMDLSLPVMGGIAATEEIKRYCPDTRVVVLSSHDEEEMVMAAFSAGASGYCLKNIPGAALFLAIKSVAEGAIWVDPKLAEKVMQLFYNRRSQISEEKKPTKKQQEDISISKRERDVLKLLSEGMKNKDIAKKLSISVSTVRTHIDHLAEKLAVTGRTQIALKAHRTGLI